MDNPAPIETQEPVQKANRFLLPAGILMILLIVAAVGTYTWYYLYSPCGVKAVEEASGLLLTQMNTYDKEYQFAATAPSASIAHPVTVLQQIFMDTQEVVVPACMQTAKSELVNYMGAVIRAFLAFGAQETESTIRDLVDQSQTHYDNFYTELEVLNKCAPFCSP
ncbi:MAG TPA: hypothetical protein VJ821_04135 [Anaerolineales bacterium]|nr:hypothetical protein [Anaerolineales bacterium]